jgi:flagellum-specific ATP synthase
MSAPASSSPSSPASERDWRNFLSDCSAFARAASPIAAEGRLTRVVGFSDDRLFLMPVTEVYGLTPGAAVTSLENRMSPPRLGERRYPPRRSQDRSKAMQVGDALLGRVLDATGTVLDGLGELHDMTRRPLHARPINPVDRATITEPLDVGVRAINALVTVGRGQRLGLFAGSGVGKSVLLGMMARYTSADVTVVGLIGERGREVKEFIENSLGAEGLRRSVVIAAPADSPPLLRLQAASYATLIAEYFRDQGKHVLLLMDSLTRYCMAQREVALAIGEPPATKGYPPSVFAKLPLLVERAGNGIGGRGSITGFYTVLTEGDDPQDPVADQARSILDGHIMLSRELAEQGHFPAIDVDSSVSRVMHALVPQAELARARRFKQLYTSYRRNRDLISVGAYVPGSDPMLDQAISLQTPMTAFLQQDMHEHSSLAQSTEALGQLLGRTA